MSGPHRYRRGSHILHTPYKSTSQPATKSHVAVAAGPELLIEALPEKVHMLDTSLIVQCPKLVVVQALAQCG